MNNIFMIAPAGYEKTETIVDIIKEQNKTYNEVLINEFIKYDEILNQKT